MLRKCSKVPCFCKTVKAEFMFTGFSVSIVKRPNTSEIAVEKRPIGTMPVRLKPFQTVTRLEQNLLFKVHT